ncbi:MAG: glycosyltransferase family 4 protein [Cyclobacteriaceae bacterium]
MKILYIHQYFKTPEEGGSIRSYYLAKGLVDNGYEVEMITSHNGKKYEIKDVDGIRVHYLPVFYDNHLSFLSRIFAFIRFMKLAYEVGRKIKKVDLIYAMTTPLSVGYLALRLKKKLGVPYYFEVGDLWPEAPIQMGFINNRFLKSFLYGVEKRIYENADKIIALSSSIRNYIEKTAPGKKVYVIPNMSDVEFFQPANSEKEHLGKFVISYFGAAGRANRLEYLLEAAKLCHGHLPQVHFKVMAYGSELTRIRHLAEQTGIQNLEFLPYSNKSGVKKLLDYSDAVYVSFADVDVLNTGSPNKFFDGLAAGKLMILNFEGWLKDIVESHKCGFTYNPQYPEDFIQKLESIVGDNHIIREYQNNARKIAEQFYSKELQLKKLLLLLNNEHHLNLSDSEVYILTA